MPRNYEPEFKKKIVRKKRPDYRKGTAHRVFVNLLEQKFSADEINQKWCTDFTCLFLADGSKRYNCSILDLHDRSVIASLTDKNITSARTPITDIRHRLRRGMHRQNKFHLIENWKHVVYNGGKRSHFIKKLKNF